MGHRAIFEIKTNVSCKFYFRFARFYAAFNIIDFCLVGTCKNVEHMYMHVQKTLTCMTLQPTASFNRMPNAFNKFNSTILNEIVDHLV